MRAHPLSCFVTGTDTGVGKTLVASGLLLAMRNAGIRAAGFKPVAAGIEPGPGGPRHEDVEQLRAASGIALRADEACGVLLTRAIAPHIGAAQEGIPIDPAALAAAARALQARAQALVVEGVGGFRVPLSDTADSAELARLLGLPVVLVVGLRLGCLSHALLTAEAIERRGLPLAGWVANRIDPAMQEPDRNREALERRLGAPLLGELAWMGASTSEARAQEVAAGAGRAWLALRQEAHS